MSSFWSRSIYTWLRRTNHTIRSCSSTQRRFLSAAVLTTCPIIVARKFCLCENRPYEETKQSLDIRGDFLNQDAVYPYVFIGLNAASISACTELLETDPAAKILILSQDHDDTYETISETLAEYQNLSNSAGKSPETASDQVETKFLSNYEIKIVPPLPDGFVANTSDFFSQDNPCYSVVTSPKIAHIDSLHKVVKFRDGRSVKYGKLLLAMDSQTKKLSVSSVLPYDKFIIDFHAYRDQKSLESRLKSGVKNVLIVGSSSRSVELASYLASGAKRIGSELNIVMVSPKRLLSRLVTPECSRILADALKTKSIQIIENSRILSVEPSQISDKLTCTTVVSSNDSKTPDGSNVVLHPEIIINCEKQHMDAGEIFISGESSPLIEKNYLDHRTFVVNPFMRIGPDMFAAGDCVSLYNPALHESQTSDFYEHSIFSGRLAASNMLDSFRTYQILPMTWSDLCDIAKIESIGLDQGESASLPSVTVWKEASTSTDDPLQKEGVMFYHRDGRIVRIATWNLAGKITLAEKVIRSELQIQKVKEVAKLFFQPAPSSEGLAG